MKLKIRRKLYILGVNFYGLYFKDMNMLSLFSKFLTHKALKFPQFSFLKAEDKYTFFNKNVLLNLIKESNAKIKFVYLSKEKINKLLKSFDELQIKVNKEKIKKLEDEILITGEEEEIEKFKKHLEKYLEQTFNILQEKNKINKIKLKNIIKKELL